MGAADWRVAARIAGRIEELEILHRVLGGSVRGVPCAVFVHGEAGVGKTRLVTAVSDEQRERGNTVLWGRCLRFGASSSPYLPFVSAFQGWVEEGNQAEGLPLPLYDDAALTERPAQVMHVIDRAVAHLTADGPVTLVLDDLQWADISSLDALAYLIAGFRHQRLAILVTYRDEGIPDGHALHGWLADMLRMPGVLDIPLDRLTQEETAQQLTDLLGTKPPPSLVTDVWERSGGNAYLTELLARGLDPEAETLPEDLPDALRSALLSRWHGLSPEARRVTQVLAVAGRPAAPEVLVGVVGADRVDDALHEATVAGVTQLDPSGLVWFRHPLLSDVLYASLLPDETRALHRVFVEVLAAEGPRGARSHSDLALHYAGAELFDESFEHCLLAADEASSVRAFPEAAVLLRNAAELWPNVSEQVRAKAGSWASLLAEAARLARLTGDLRGALALLDQAVPLVDEAQEPLTASRVLRLRSQIAHTGLGVDLQPVEEMRRAAELSAAVPDSDEHALALADLSDAELWSGDRVAALEHAHEAVEAATRSGDAAALSYALGSLSNARMEEDGAEEQAREAVRLAMEAGRAEYVGLASIALSNVLESAGRLSESADVLAEAHAAGLSFSGLTGLLGAYAANAMTPLGRFAEAKAILRDVLASRPGGIVGIQARETAVVVALRAGSLRDATKHLERLRELAANFEDFPGLHGPSIQAEYLLAVGKPAEAIDLLEGTVETHSRVEPKYGDMLLLWAARAAAALPPSERQRALDRVVAARARCHVPPFTGAERDPVQQAVRAMYEAEVARLHGAPDIAERWRAALPLLDSAGLRFVAAEARLRLAEALLGARDRSTARAVLREAHAMAQQMGAARLLQEIGAVASTARVPLADPVVPSQPDGNPHGLTPRELEVLGHLVAGRSYAEIAAALYISEKTVSVHVSNLLRKTGTTSGVEAASWARRSGIVPAG